MLQGLAGVDSVLLLCLPYDCGCFWRFRAAVCVGLGLLVFGCCGVVSLVNSGFMVSVFWVFG